MIKQYLIALLLLISTVGYSQEIPKKPSKERLVNDFASVLSSAEVNNLESALVQFDSKTSTQIAIVTVTDLNGYSVIDMATRIMKNWGVGGENNNGVVILFKPKTADSKGEIAITTGYGVEHLVTDALAKKIVEYDIIPQFKNGDIYGGFGKGIITLFELTSGEYTGEDYLAKNSSKSGGFPVAIIIIVAIIILNVGRRSGSQSQYSSRGSSLPFWLLMGGLGGSGGSRGGSYNDFSSGGGSFGGFGGGFGGGGGASGSW